MIERKWKWLGLSGTLLFYCCLVLVLSAQVAVEFDSPLINQLGTLIGLFCLFEAGLASTAVWGSSFENFTIWQWRQLLFVREPK